MTAVKVRDCSENGLGDGAFSFCRAALALWNDTGCVHFVEADMQTDCACHQQVVMLADNRTVRAVLFPFVCQILIKTSSVAFSVKMFPDAFYERGDDHGLCRYIGVETVFARNPLPYLVLGLTPCIQVGIYA